MALRWSKPGRSKYNMARGLNSKNYSQAVGMQVNANASSKLYYVIVNVQFASIFVVGALRLASVSCF